MPVAAANLTDKAAQVSRLFARIVPTYDLVNRVMSLGQDQAWRRLATELALPGPGGIALDLACGTGDLSLALAARAARVVGVDVCPEMLPPAVEKTDRAGAAGRVGFLLGEALSLPFPDAAFDCVTVAFGVRNMADPVAAFGEMRRVVAPGGRVVCLEIMRPDRSFLGGCYRAYLTRIIPFIGGVISRQPEAYRYLSSSVMGFYSAEELREKMQAAGFSSVACRKLNFNTIAIHVGVR